MSLGEFELIDNYFKRQVKQKSVIKSVGDDCAVVALDSQHQLVMSMDTLVSGRHFPESSTPSQIATRAFCTCLSDLAAMGATPRWFTLALTLPDSNSLWLEEFSRSLFAIADKYECDLIGGDTTQGPLVVTLQVHGTIENNKTLTRDAAKKDDTVFVTGCLGDGAAALSLLTNKFDVGSFDNAYIDYLLERFYQPKPQIESGKYLVPYANAAIDISDGLLADLQHIANASAVDIEIDANAIPLSAACEQIAGNRENALQYALTGGDDYQLAFTVPQKNLPIIECLITEKMIEATHIGKVKMKATDTSAVYCFQNDRPLSISNKKGYQHFAP